MALHDSAVGGAQLGRHRDEQIVEAPPEHPSDVHGVVHDEFLELLVRQVAHRQGSAEMLTRLLVDTDRAGAADADDAAVAAGEVLVARPDLAIQIIEIAWPSGALDTVSGVDADQLVVVREGGGIVGRTPLERRSLPGCMAR